MRARVVVVGRALRVAAVLTLGLGASASETAAQPGPAPTVYAVTRGDTTYRFGAEYWIRLSRTQNFDFDPARDDRDSFSWHRIKPLFNVQRKWLELTLQGQDSRSHGVANLNPDGTSTYAGRTSQLDFVKAYVRITPRNGVAIKAGREQADGLDLGLSRKLASASNYGTVLRSFDQLSVRWEPGRAAVAALVAMPVDNVPYALNRRHAGERFAAAQGSLTTRGRAHRLYALARTTDAGGPLSETGVRGSSATYGIGLQETGPLLVRGLLWDIEGIVEWGHRSTDRLRAGAVFVTATHAFSSSHSVYAGYYQSSGDGRTGDGTTHLFDPLYASGFNNYGYIGLSRGRNISDIRVGGSSKLAAPVTVLWTYHDQGLSVRDDQWYAIFTPNVRRPTATSSRIGRELDVTVLLRPPFAPKMAIGLGYMGYLPGNYLRGTGPHATAHQIAIDVWGSF